MEESQNWFLWDLLKEHFGHDVKIVCYGHPRRPSDVCLECESCNEVIIDADVYTICAREDEPGRGESHESKT